MGVTSAAIIVLGLCSDPIVKFFQDTAASVGAPPKPPVLPMAYVPGQTFKIDSTHPKEHDGETDYALYVDEQLEAMIKSNIVAALLGRPSFCF